MKLLKSLLVVVGLSAALLACTYQPQSKTDLLAESGFSTLSLNTPAKIAAFKGLPPHRLSKTVFKGHSVWVYPDRNVCGCLYIGGQTAYNTYIKKATQQMIDTRVNQMYDNNNPQPYNPVQEDAFINWGDAWDAADAYGLYLN
jgi:hypothetical protein